MPVSVAGLYSSFGYLFAFFACKLSESIAFVDLFCAYVFSAEHLPGVMGIGIVKHYGYVRVHPLQ